jgi:preprotein translocase SecE subunit
MEKITEFLRKIWLKIKNMIAITMAKLKDIQSEMKNINWSTQNNLLKYLLQFIVIAAISMVVLFILDTVIIKLLKLVFF